MASLFVLVWERLRTGLIYLRCWQQTLCVTSLWSFFFRDLHNSVQRCFPVKTGHALKQHKGLLHWWGWEEGAVVRYQWWNTIQEVQTVQTNKSAGCIQTELKAVWMQLWDKGRYHLFFIILTNYSINLGLRVYIYKYLQKHHYDRKAPATLSTRTFT